MKKNLIRRLHCPSDIKVNLSINLSKEQSHYIANVLRLNINDKVLLFNDKDGEFNCTITGNSKKNVTCTPTSLERNIYLEPNVRLVFAPIKNGKIENIVQKATELGVTNIQPVITERTIVNKVNNSKLEAIAIEAAEQCERITLPKIQAIDKLSNIINELNKNDVLFFCDETGNGADIASVFSEYKDKQDTKFSILVGPEGGFTEKEIDILINNDFTVPISMGPRILRADTAITSALSCFSSIIGDWKIKGPDFRYNKNI